MLGQHSGRIRDAKETPARERLEQLRVDGLVPPCLIVHDADERRVVELDRSRGHKVAARTERFEGQQVTVCVRP
jgi:hypothetical protein